MKLQNQIRLIKEPTKIEPDVEHKKNWEIITKKKNFFISIPTYPVFKCKCKADLVIKYSSRKLKLYLSCRNYIYANPDQSTCSFFSYLPGSINNN